MMREIDRRTHAVVDLTSCREVEGAEAADSDTGTVLVRHRNSVTGDVTREEFVHLQHGMAVVRRR